jgi:DNA-binding transcriptional LysR family regulator
MLSEIANIAVLRVLRTVAEELSFTRAAEKLELSPPRVSLLVKNAESALGVKLFERTSRTVALTPAGREILVQVEAAERALRNIAITAARLRASERNTLLIGSPLITSLVPGRKHFVEGFLGAYRQVQVHLHNLEYPALQSALDEGRIDCILAVEAFEARECRAVTVSVGRCHVFLPESHRLAAKTEIALADLAGENVAILPQSIGAAHYAHVSAPIVSAGARTVEAPEASVSTLARFARKQDLLCLYGVWPGDAPRSAGIVAVPLSERQLDYRLRLVARDEAMSAPLAALFVFAARFAEAEAEAGETCLQA